VITPGHARFVGGRGQLLPQVQVTVTVPPGVKVTVPLVICCDCGRLQAALRLIVAVTLSGGSPSRAVPLPEAETTPEPEEADHLTVPPFAVMWTEQLSLSPASHPETVTATACSEVGVADGRRLAGRVVVGWEVGVDVWVVGGVDVGVSVGLVGRSDGLTSSLGETLAEESPVTAPWAGVPFGLSDDRGR
jgi:hypothetical protein